MVVRYMGTKRHMADHVRDAIADLVSNGRAIDLFSGMGSVAESLKDTCPVTTNDALSFTAALSRARFTGGNRKSKPRDVVVRLRAAYDCRLDELAAINSKQLAEEATALLGEKSDLANYMRRAAHVGNTASLRRRARQASEAAGSDHYSLASMYFGAGYLSLGQAIAADAIRFAIDMDTHPAERDWLISAWISAISVLANAPGHTAQYLKPNTSSAHARIVRTWGRSLWAEFGEALDRVGQVGTPTWRKKNAVYVGDALDLVSSGALSDIDVVYADPPYTKDQYSRYYHVYETLYRYDYPDSSEAGRSRSDRFATGFSLKSAVIASFHDLCRNVARMQVPLVISYPSDGLLASANSDVREVAGAHFREIEVRSVDASHSTMGASTGASKKSATEYLYVCTN